MITIASRHDAITLALGTLASAIPLASPAAAEMAFDASLESHRLSPEDIHVPAAEPVVLEIAKQDRTSEELESKVLEIAKLIPLGTSGTVHPRSLEAPSWTNATRTPPSAC